MLVLMQAWEPWTRGDGVRAEKTSRPDGVFVAEDCNAERGGVVLLISKCEQPWDNTILAMRASVGKLV